jgi:hypothetical protein
MEQMNSKQRQELKKIDFWSTILGDNYKRTAEDVVRELVDCLINALYIPCNDPMVDGECDVIKLDPKRIEHFGIDENEPINWTNLSCNEVKKFEDGSFLVVIDEAAPDVCQTFCEYIEKYMLSFGWKVRAETEW